MFAIAFFLFVASTQAQDCKHARILGATFGTKDVTSTVAHKYNLGTKTIEASTDNFGDPLPNVTKTLTVVYEICQNVATVIAEEDSSVSIPWDWWLKWLSWTYLDLRVYNCHKIDINSNILRYLILNFIFIFWIFL